MSKATRTSEQSATPESHLQFNEEIEMTESGFSFRPIAGFELEIDGSVYMYSEDGNLEINLCGGELNNETSIAELNDELTSDFIENVDEFSLFEAGKDTIQGITGFLNEIRFVNAEEDGIGRALICSPFINQYFFLLVISSAEQWASHGQHIFNVLKSKITFHPQFKPEVDHENNHDHPDLTIETYQSLTPEENFLLTIEKDDVSLLLAARTYTANEKIFLTEIVTPNGDCLYHYEPESETFSSIIVDRPLIGNQGEVCFYYPPTDRQALLPGNYQFFFITETMTDLQEIQVIIRSKPSLGLQKIDLNFWLAIDNGRFNDPGYLHPFKTTIHQALTHRLAPVDLAPGKIECYFPAPDEMALFTTVNLDTDLADCSYMIAETVSNGRALNIGLVERLTMGNPPISAYLQAVSSGSPGMILSSVSPHACIMIGLAGYQNDDKEINFDSLADAIIQQLVAFSGISIQDEKQGDFLSLNRETIRSLRHHPIFYDPD